MRTFVTRASATLTLLCLICHGGLAVCAETELATGSVTAIDDVVAVDAEQDPGGAVDLAIHPDELAIQPDELAIRGGDDAWLISTRRLGSSSWENASTFDPDVSHYSDSGDWIESDLSELLASERRLTIVYVHGNQVPFDDAIKRAWRAFGVLQADPAAPPMRLIIWNWPSDEIRGLVRDIRTKGFRTNTEGQYLGWFLSQMDPETPVSMIGYSFGARVVTGALHVLGGGTLVDQSTPLTLEIGDREPIQVVLLAAAVHNNWLASGGFHERFWSFAERVLVLYNSRDPALKRYRFIQKHGRPAAIGYTGARGLDKDMAARTEQRDVRCSVGKTHNEAVFFSSAEVVEGIQQHVLLHAAP